MGLLAGFQNVRNWKRLTANGAGYRPSRYVGEISEIAVSRGGRDVPFSSLSASEQIKQLEAIHPALPNLAYTAMLLVDSVGDVHSAWAGVRHHARQGDYARDGLSWDQDQVFALYITALRFTRPEALAEYNENRKSDGHGGPSPWDALR